MDEDKCYRQKNNSSANQRVCVKRLLARWTGLEPATTGVTGRYSNQLSYHRAEYLTNQISKKMVGDDGVEPPTFCL